MFLIAFATFLSGLYIILILIFIIGWNRNYTFEPKGNESVTTLISVIVACKNEQSTIENLISYIAQQSHQNFELIIVNDHSTDSTKSIVKQAIATLPKAKLVDAVGFGKKSALREGIQQSTADLIVTIDADCSPTFHWLESIVCFQNKLHSDLIIGPVKNIESKDIFLKIQALEFVSLVASGGGAAGAKMPILCNAANLAFTRETWMNSNSDLHDEEQSGDDIFLLQSVKKRGGVIRFLKSEAAFVNTKPSTSLKEFLNQRRRWASKSPSYTDWNIILVAVLVFSMAIVELLLLYNALTDMKFLIVFGGFFSTKFLIDSLFLQLVRKFFHLTNIWVETFLLSVIYPFYIVFVAVSALLYKPKSWK